MKALSPTNLRTPAARTCATRVLAALLTLLLTSPHLLTAELVSRPIERDFTNALHSGSVELNFNGVLTLTSEQVITADTVILSLQTNTLISGNGSNRLFTIAPNATLTLRNFTLTNGALLGTNGSNGAIGKAGANGTDAQGGAIYIQAGATLQADSMRFTSHRAVGGNGGNGGSGDFTQSAGRGGLGGRAYGGTLYSLGTLRLTNCTFQDSLVRGGTGGAGGDGAGSQDGAAGGNGGLALGGFIYTAGSNQLIDCTLELGQAQPGNGGNGGNGGGLHNGGNGGNGDLASGGAIHADTNATLILTGCFFSGNVSTGSIAGLAGSETGLWGSSGLPGISGAARAGALTAHHANCTLLDCDFEDNQAHGADGARGATESIDQAGASGRPGAPAQGGALFIDSGDFDATECSFVYNLSFGGNGGQGGLTPRGTGSGDGGNGGNGAPGQGGALFITGTASAAFTDCTFNQNESGGGGGGPGSLGQGSSLAFNGTDGIAGPADGGALHQESGSLTVTGTTFSYNIAKGADGIDGAAGFDTFEGFAGGNGAAASGAGIHAHSGTLKATNSTFFGNLAAGGNGGEGGDGAPDGFTGTDGGKGGKGGRADGAGLYFASTNAARLVHCTFATNQVVAGNGGNGGQAGTEFSQSGSRGASGTASGGALFSTSPSLNLVNTLLTQSGTATSPASNVFGNAGDLGGNLSSDSTPAFSSSTSSNDLSLRLDLATFGDNGGPTHTVLPAAACLDRGIALESPATDQRGVPRLSPPEIGAVETEQPSLSLLWRTNSVVLSWTATDPNYAVDHTTTFTNWSLLLSPNRSGEVTVTSTVAGPKDFYRLRR